MRALALIAVVALAAAACVCRPHTHVLSGENDCNTCVACQLRDNPGELGDVPAVAPVARFEVAAPRPCVEVPAVRELCLARAPKQGPPAA